MAVISISTKIHAPIQRCFDLSRSIDLHTVSTSHTHEKAIAGRTSGLIELNETVTWRARHFGVYQKLTVEIVELQSPDYFKDVMLKGAFKKMEHKHFFEQKTDHTLMSDHLVFEAPLGLLGRVAENIILKNYLTRFLTGRNKLIKQVAESELWEKFLSS